MWNLIEQLIWDVIFSLFLQKLNSLVEAPFVVTFELTFDTLVLDLLDLHRLVVELGLSDATWRSGTQINILVGNNFLALHISEILLIEDDALNFIVTKERTEKCTIRWLSPRIVGLLFNKMVLCLACYLLLQTQKVKHLMKQRQRGWAITVDCCLLRRVNLKRLNSFSKLVYFRVNAS